MWHGNSWADFPKCMAWRVLMYDIPSIKMAQDRFNEEIFTKYSFVTIPTGIPNDDLP